MLGTRDALEPAYTIKKLESDVNEVHMSNGRVKTSLVNLQHREIGN
jgi:hypothetical protein